MDTDRNLLFGVIAMQADLIDAAQFVEACLLWTARKNEPLADLLLAKGWIEAEDRTHVEYLLERKLRKHGGNGHASLAALPAEVRHSLAALGDDDICRSLVDGDSQLATVAHVPGPTERYARLRLHATGGIGRVWLAYDNGLGRNVALKELRPERAEHPTLGARFLQEARITGQLEHPGIVPVYELVRSTDGRLTFYTMRFVKGRTLSEAARAYHQKRRVGQADTLELPALLNAFVTVCNTVAYAHSRGVIHRDLKGQNVILGDFGEVVVLDWGLAKLVGRNETEDPMQSILHEEPGSDSGYTVHGQALGTPAYMAPEQSAGRLDLIDRHTDVYGLGAILYEILTGAPPFTGDNTDEVLRKVREEPPAPPRQLWSEVPAALETLCLRALAKQAADRPATASELAQEVQGWQDYERRKAEEALRASEALYHSLVESLPCAVVRKDAEGRFTFANQRFCELVGQPLDQLLGKTGFDLYPPDMAEKFHRDDQKVMDTGEVFEDIEQVDWVIGRRYCHTLKTPVCGAGGTITGVQAIGWDVTERKLAEEELRKSRERFELAVQGSQDGLWDWNLLTGATYFSPRYKAMLGFEDHEFHNDKETFVKWVHPDDLDRVGNEIRAHFKSRDALLGFEVRLRHKDGSYRWIRSRGIALRDQTGWVHRMVGSHQDITDQKMAEAALAHERVLFNSMMETIPDYIVFKDLEGRYIRVSASYAALFHLTQEEVLGKTIHDLFPAEYAQRDEAAEREIIRTGKPDVAADVRVPLSGGRHLGISDEDGPS